MAEEGRTVEFRSDDDDEVALRLSFDPDPSGIGLDVFDLEVRTRELTFEHGVLTAGGDSLDAFFAGLVRDWRGWADTRRWHAVEGAMRIDATHRGRVIELLFHASPRLQTGRVEVSPSAVHCAWGVSELDGVRGRVAVRAIRGRKLGTPRFVRPS